MIGYFNNLSQDAVILIWMGFKFLLREDSPVLWLALHDSHASFGSVVPLHVKCILLQKSLDVPIFMTFLAVSPIELHVL